MNEMLLSLDKMRRKLKTEMRNLNNKQKERGTCGSSGTSCGMYR